MDALTGARFVAAVHVFAVHAWAARGMPEPFRKVEQIGYMAVSFSFILSGFVLSATYGKRGRFDLRDFWVARFARIYPLYFVCVTAALGIGIAHHTAFSSWGETINWISTYLLVQNWIHTGAPPVATGTWTLCVEALFYLTFPFILPWVLRQRNRTLWATFALAALGYAVLCFGFKFDNTLPPFRLPEFYMGVVLGHFHRLGVLGEQNVRRTGVFYGCFIGSLLVPQIFPSASGPVAGLLPPLFGGMILALANFDGVPGRLLRSKAFVFLGGASYALYLSHPLVIYGLHTLFGYLHRPADGVSFALVSSILVVAVSCALYVVIEEPTREWLRRSLSRRSPEIQPENAVLKNEPL